MDELHEPQARPLRAPGTYRFPAERDKLLPWSYVEERLIAARSYWLATVGPGDRPHVTPLWGVWVEGALYFDGLPTTRWGRNLAANPHVSINLESADEVVILTGAVEDLETSVELGDRVVAAWSAKYGDLEPQPATRGIFRLRPLRVRAFTGSLERGSGWDLGPR